MAFYSQLDLREAFSLFDRNGDGKISCGEIEAVLKKMGYNLSPDELESMLKKVDKDGNGVIDFEEFTDMLQGESISSESEAELMKVFQSLDKKGRGYIGVRELKNMTKSVGQRISKKEIRQMISIADLDGDGKVNYDEFKKIMKNKEASEWN